MSSRNKVALIGIEGLSVELLEAIAKSPQFSNISALYQQATSLKIQSALPMASSAAWTTAVTGVNAGKHGIFNDSIRVPGTYNFVRPNARARQTAPLWQIIDAYGYKVGSFNLPVSYPPDSITGFFISGSDIPGVDSPFTYPNGLYALLEKQFGTYKANITEATGDTQSYLENINQLTNYQFKVFEFLFHKFNTIDIFLVAFTALERLLQLFGWHTLASDISDNNPDPNIRIAQNVFFNFFKQLDQLLELVTENNQLSTILMASHGQQESRTRININQWLVEAGFLKVKSESSQHFPTIDWSGSQAYGLGNYGHIYLNKKGREPLGQIEEGRPAKDMRQRISKMLRDKFKAIQPLLELKILAAEDIFSGPLLHSAPDLILEFPPGYYIQNDLLPVEKASATSTEDFTNKIMPAFHHSADGLLVLNNIKPQIDQQRNTIILEDITPTILSLLNIPIPEAMEGNSIYPYSVKQKMYPPQEFNGQYKPTNIETAQQLIEALEEALQLKQAELAVAHHHLEPLQIEVKGLRTQIALLEKEVHGYKSGRVMKLLLAQGRIFNSLKRQFKL